MAEINKEMSVRDVVGEIRIRLKQAGIEDFEWESFLILNWITGLDRGDYFADPNKIIETPICARIWEAVGKREQRIPLQYLMHTTEFMGYPFYVDARVLIPRQDTECLVERAIDIIKQKEKNGKRIRKVLDLCTGSGCIGISIKKTFENIDVTLADISADALKVAEKNALDLQAQTKIIQTDLFSNIKESYDVILSNPPYIPTKVVEGLMPEVRDHEPHLALDGTEDGLWFYKKITEEARNHLNPDGVLMYEIGADQGTDLREILETHHYKNIKVEKDLAGLDRIVIGTF